MTDQEFTYLKSKLLALTRIDLDSYKTQQMRRRLDAFVASQGVAVAQYCKDLEQDKAALLHLRDFLTINVSEFFRDTDQFNHLKASVLPPLLSRTPRLNIWSAGCSHGAEPYSAAILLEELSPGIAHRILATDLDEKILARAKQGGPYPATDVRSLDRSVLLKYFIKSEDGYRVVDKIRRKVEFRQQDLLRDPFESGFDLIMCRNVVIYFTDKAKEALMVRFRQSLKDGGVLFIGASETLLTIPDLGLERIGPSFYSRSAHRPRAIERPLAATAAHSAA